jgi:hypothetical protein
MSQYIYQIYKFYTQKSDTVNLVNGVIQVENILDGVECVYPLDTYRYPRRYNCHLYMDGCDEPVQIIKKSIKGHTYIAGLPVCAKESYTFHLYDDETVEHRSIDAGEIVDWQCLISGMVKDIVDM